MNSMSRSAQLAETGVHTRPRKRAMDVVNKGLARRYRAERRFKMYGLAAIILSLLFLSLLFINICEWRSKCGAGGGPNP